MSADTPAARLLSADSSTIPAPTLEALRDRAEIGRPASAAAAVEPLLVPAPEAARLCGVSAATWYRLKSAGKVPAAVTISSRVLWRVEELRRWCAAGCPDLRTWQAMENVSGRRGTGR
jgi:predicted DNA-binding transcriptional regulator AlpA